MSYTKIKYILIIVLGLLFILPKIVNAKNDGKKQRKMAKTSASQVANARIDINNLNALQSNVGYSDYNLNSNLEGTEFPRGSGKNAVFESGLLWGGFVRGDTSGQVRVGGSAYISGLEPGPILDNGQPADPSDSKWSIYTVRPDVFPNGPDVDLSGEVAAYAEGGQTVTASDLRAQYEANWTNWPAAGTANDLGAPFEDVNKDGKYEPDIDIPGVPGADQTVFYVANDEDGTLTQGLYGTQPLGIELHATFWAYAQQGALGNMYFKKWEIINKGYQKYTIDSMFVSFWSDVDLGDANNDLVACDTTLSLQIVYNGEATDKVYDPLPPPADGFDFFQGPTVPGSPTDSAILIEQPFKFSYVHGKKNLPMTAAYFFVNSSSNFADPSQGETIGSTQFYRYFNGEYGVSGDPFINPKTNKPTKFAFSGNPVTGTGWIDGIAIPPGDRREGMASGPFNLAPGDTQQVVVAEIFAGAIPSVNYLQAVTLVEVYDKTAQNAYDHFFNLPTPPPAPHVQVNELNNKISLDWGEVPSFVAATENSVIKDELDSVDVTGGGYYKFEGYNVYQLPYKSASISEAKLLATYDLIDSVKYVPYVDLSTRQVNPSYYIQYGTDSGIKRFFIDSTDAFNGNKPLNNGTPYYYAVTAYSYNPKGVPRALENPISVITATPHSNNPGVTQSFGNLSNVVHSGLATATASVHVVNPPLTTGDKYQVSFHDEMYKLDSAGVWADITAPAKKLQGIKTLVGSSISSSAEWADKAKGAILIHYIVDVVSPNYDYCDGVKLQLPFGVTIDSAFNTTSNNTGNPIVATVDRTTNTIVYSDINPDSLAAGDSTVRSQNGVFAGGEDIKVIVHPAHVPIVTKYTMYDDNWGDNNGYYGGFVDVNGVDTLTTISNVIVTQHQWNVTDLTTGNVVLKNQTVYGGVDIYDPATYFKANSIYGPGGSSHPIGGKDIGPQAVVFDGIQVSVDGSFDAPTTFQSLELNGSPLTINASSGDYQMSDFSLSFSGFGDGAMAYNTITSYGGAGGTHSIDELQQDYEIKWTGVRKTTVTGGDTVVSTGSGGQLATLFGASNYDIANDPANPNPGSSNPFLIRIPFQVWNIDKNEQVNVLVYHRLGNITDNPFNEWNYFDRMYVWIINTKYDSTAPILPTSQVVADSATWNWVFFQSNYKMGDVINVTYANPIQLGKDTFTFTVPKTDYTTALAKQDVSKINVFPNPYYGVNSNETTKYVRFVTFSHLPATATIHIFNLAGVMVKTINHTDGTQFQTWDLTNDSNLPVASGLYIAYIDMPRIGMTKILKLAIIQEQQFPDHF
jgi:hypothetical protein